MKGSGIMVIAYIVWKIKEGVKIKKEDLTYFSPGGYTFTHKSGKHINFDFMDSWGNYNEDDNILDFNQKELDSELISDGLINYMDQDLIREEYNVDFFKDGKIELENSKDEMFCSMDLRIAGEIVEVDFSKYVEPVYMELFDSSNPDENVILLNKLTKEEYEKYFIV